MRQLGQGARGRVALLTQWFPPEPAVLPLRIAQALERDGWSTRVVTGVPNYPMGKVFPGYSARRPSQDRVDGLGVRRCPVYPSHDRSAVRRAGNYLSFAVSASWYGRLTLASADAVVVYSSPETAAIPAVIARAITKTPYVLVVEDLWPESVIETGLLRSANSLRIAEVALSQLDFVACRAASRILVISYGMRRRLIARGVAESKIRVMHNWADEGISPPNGSSRILRRLIGAADQDVVFLYGGNHGSAQGLHSWVTALTHMRDLEHLHVVFVGDGVEKEMLRQRVVSGGLQQIHFLDAVAPRTFAEFAADADAQIISLSARPLFEITIPSKVQAAMFEGSCLLASVAGDPAELVRRAGAGFVANPEDPADIQRIIREAVAAGPERRRAMGAAGRDFYLAHLSSERGSQILSEAVRESIEESPCRS